MITEIVLDERLADEGEFGISSSTFDHPCGHRGSLSHRPIIGSSKPRTPEGEGSKTSLVTLVEGIRAPTISITRTMHVIYSLTQNISKYPLKSLSKLKFRLKFHLLPWYMMPHQKGHDTDASIVS